jgi:hypothetical protein
MQLSAYTLVQRRNNRLQSWLELWDSHQNEIKPMLQNGPICRDDDTIHKSLYQQWVNRRPSNTGLMGSFLHVTILGNDIILSLYTGDYSSQRFFIRRGCRNERMKKMQQFVLKVKPVHVNTEVQFANDSGFNDLHRYDVNFSTSNDCLQYIQGR